MGRASPKNRTATMRVVSERIAGCSAARAMRYPAEVINPIPKTTASAPSRVDSARRPRGGRASAKTRRRLPLKAASP